MIKLGFTIARPTWRLTFGVSNEYFFWTPGEIESGSSSPAERFNSISDEYWLWGWLYFYVFFARCN